MAALRGLNSTREYDVTDPLPKLAILGGTGKEGTGLATRWARAGYTVLIGSRSLERAEQTAAEINSLIGVGIVCGLRNADAARQADIAVLTVPADAQAATLDGLRDDLAGKILVDATARVDARDPRPPEGKASARIAQELLGPSVRVVGAFQNVPAHGLHQLDRELASDVLVCADDDDARRQVVALAEAAGMRAWEAGGLDNGIVVEGLTALIIALNKRYKSRTGGIRISGIKHPAAAEGQAGGPKPA
jgi:8-hydroxy-5-deazaflavin:NADPH oxidoreductase